MRTVTLRARSLDHRARAALSPGATFGVHTVFARALNLVDEQGWLFGLVGPRGGNGPGLAVLEGLPAAGLESLGLAAGDRATIEPAGDLVIGGRLRVHLGGARLWERPAIAGPIQPGLVRRNVSAAAAYAFRARGGDGLGGLLPYLEPLLAGAEPPIGLSLLLRTAWLALRDLLATWPGASPEAALRLVGLGPGQTPAGDDLLSGLLVAALRIGNRDGPTHAFAALLVETARGRTTDLGYARVRYAAEAELDERSELTLAALIGGDQSSLEAAVRDLLAYGHSSGLDTLVGLLLGCWAMGARS